MARVGWFLLVVGIGIAAVWALLLTTGQVPEVAEARVDIWFHLAAELLTAAVLIVAGLLVLRRTARASLVAGVALGALGYTAVNSAGYYAEAGDWPGVGMFGVIAVATIFAGHRLFASSRPGTEVGDRTAAETGTPDGDRGVLSPGARP